MNVKHYLMWELYRHCLCMSTWWHHGKRLLRQPDLQRSRGNLWPLQHRRGSDDVEIGMQRPRCSCCRRRWRWWCCHRFGKYWGRLLERLQGKNLFISLLLVVVLFTGVVAEIGIDLEAGDELDGLDDQFGGRNQSFFTSQVKR